MASTSTSKAKRRKAREKRRKRRESQAPGTGADQAKKKGALREWFDALIFAVVVMLILRTLFFGLFRIPTPSMEKNLLVGDYLLVSKLHYGTRTPISIGIPFTQVNLIPGFELPHTRLPGFSEPERWDALVFNWPGEAEDHQPIDRKTHYIKRLVGLPGETVEVRDKVLHIDGTPHPLREGMQQHWNVYKTDPRFRLSDTSLRTLGVSVLAQGGNTGGNPVRVEATAEAVEALRASPWVERIEPFVVPEAAASAYSPHMYPPGRAYTPDNYGPVTIPKAGVAVALSAENWPVYEPIIRRFEGRDTGTRNGTFLIDGAAATSYTFSQDYFFAMGDNRDNSEDSRFWGFVPMSHVVGKAVVVYFSWDSEAMLPRIGRMFSLID